MRDAVKLVATALSIVLVLQGFTDDNQMLAATIAAKHTERTLSSYQVRITHRYVVRLVDTRRVDSIGRVTVDLRKQEQVS